MQGLVLENEVLAHQPLLVNGLEQAFTEVKEFLASFSGRQVVMPWCSRPTYSPRLSAQSTEWSLAMSGNTVTSATGKADRPHSHLDSHEDANWQVVQHGSCQLAMLPDLLKHKLSEQMRR